MPLTLYYLEYSQPTRSVNLVIHALGLQAQYKEINLFKEENMTPEFLKLNPLHTLPVIDDDGFILWESRAIMTYLVSKYGKDDSLYPKDLKKRAIVDQRLHYSNDIFFALKQIFKPLFYENVKTVPADHIAKCAEIQENVEKLLEGQKFMAGNSLTVADYSYVTIIDNLEVICPSKGKFPLTQAWFDRCKSSMKDFEKVNTAGANKINALLREKLPQ